MDTAVNTATDLFLAVFPTIVFWNLNLRLRIKISLIVLLSLGLVYVDPTLPRGLSFRLHVQSIPQN